MIQQLMSMHRSKITKILLLHAIIAIASGCASSQVVDHSDPLEPANRKIFAFNEMLDGYIVRPVAETYVDITLDSMRIGVRNFFDNLAYPNVVLNSMLQGKFHQGTQDLLRFLYNTTFGVVGLFDVASQWGLPRHEEDLGQTLAIWGIGQGAYLSIPFLGPNTARNTTDYASSILLNPLNYLSGGATVPLTVLEVVNKRATLLRLSNLRDQAALDSYSFTRGAFLQKRESLIYDGNPPAGEFEDFFDEDEPGEGLLIIE